MAGDCFRQIISALKGLTEFTRDFQESGRPVSLKLIRINLGKFVIQQVLQFKDDCESTIGYKQCPDGLNVDADQDLMGKVVNVNLKIDYKQCPDGLNVDADQDSTIKVDNVILKIDYNNCSDELIVDVDQNLIGRVVDAILNNAKQAIVENRVSDPRITVATKIETTPGGASFAIVSISDNGPGIPQARKQKIFQPFFTSRTELGGSGLGLTSARRYVEAHGGTLQEVGISGEGAVFVIRLPMPLRALPLSKLFFSSF